MIVASITWLREAVACRLASLACDGGCPGLQLQETAGNGAGTGGRGAHRVQQVPHHVRVVGLRSSRYDIDIIGVQWQLF